jgi:beta-1,4-N-acetylglucosaminyltransferase
MVGTSHYGFNRLLEAVDINIAGKYSVFMQVGSSTYKPINSEYNQYLPRRILIEKIKEADIIISQGGYGTMMDSILLQKRIIVVPREERFSELVGDQKELVNYYDNMNYVRACYDVSTLDSMVEDHLNNTYPIHKYAPESKIRIRNIIEEYCSQP